MGKISNTKPLNVEEISFTDGSTLKNRTVCIFNGFLIVEANKPEQAPTWYNLQTVEALYKVTIDERPQAQQIRIINWL